MTQIASQISKCLRICRSPRIGAHVDIVSLDLWGGHSQMGKLGWAASTIRKHMWQHRLAHRELLQYKMSQKKRNLVKVVQNPCSNFHKSVFFEKVAPPHYSNMIIMTHFLTPSISSQSTLCWNWKCALGTHVAVTECKAHQCYDAKVFYEGKKCQCH